MSFDDHSSQVIALLGTTPNIGTTLIGLTVGVRLAELTKKRVAYICLNLKSSKLHRYMGIGENRASLDELLPHLRSGSFNRQMLNHAMHRYSNMLELYMLFGNRYRETAEYYGVEELLGLIHEARKAHDYVLLDVSAYWDNAGTISALLEADSVLLMTTNALTHFQEDYLSWIGVMGEHMQLHSKALYCTVIKQHGGLYGLRHCYSQLAGKALPAVTIPGSLYEAIDRGEMKLWLHQSGEGRKWLSAFAQRLAPPASVAEQKSNKYNKLTKRKLGWDRTVSAATALLFKHN